ncbi:hypothetical protein SLE2022_228540 [Rubroshorea leprosula]
MMLRSSPEWLPAGWTLQSRVQQTGRKITHYMNLDTGEKLFSKDDLIRFTKMGKPQCNDPQTVSRQSKPSDNDHVQVSLAAVRSNENPDWLPEGWFVELKTHKSGASSGRQYKPLSAAKRDSLENGTEKIHNAKANNSGKSWKKKELKLPHRSSKRLAGLESELVAHEVALQTLSTKHCKIKANTDKVLVDNTTHYLQIDHRMGISNQASAVVTTQ